MEVLIDHGMLLESAHGPLPNVAELVAGERIRGSWWGHPASHAIFAAINTLADSPDVVRTRLVNGKVTLVHRRVWCALVRVAGHFPIDRLAAIREEHTATGAHRVVTDDFPGWVPPDVLPRRSTPDGGRRVRRTAGVPPAAETGLTRARDLPQEHAVLRSGAGCDGVGDRRP